MQQRKLINHVHNSYLHHISGRSHCHVAKTYQQTKNQGKILSCLFWSACWKVVFDYVSVDIDAQTGALTLDANVMFDYDDAVMWPDYRQSIGMSFKQ